MNLLWTIIAIIKTKKSQPHMNKLDDKVVPRYYSLDIDVGEDRYSGSVEIDCFAKVKANYFELNVKDLIIKGVKLGGVNCEYDMSDEKIVIKKAVDGQFIVRIEFVGEYSKGMDGFYKSRQNDSVLYSTHFEPMDARKMFPCFDQPNMKAVFRVRMRVPDGYVALSNTNGILGHDGWYEFAKTPKMSTYLLAVVVGKLDYIETVAGKSNIPVRVWAHPDEVTHGQFALDVAKVSLEFYEEYFGTQYALDKLDMVAIPEFSMGAMENWGLVTYRSTSLLYHLGQTSLRAKKNIAVTVAHELAHMWFGNLVTMQWWDELWLNEGFATWAATLALQKRAQRLLQMDYWAAFVNDETESGLHRDALRCTHAVHARDATDVNQLFDAISYSKGASIIRMLERWLGEDVFRQGLQKYFKGFAYTNTVKDDLWSALANGRKDDNIRVGANKSTSASNLIDVIKLTDNFNTANSHHNFAVKELVDPWISQAGFPWIDVVEEADGLRLRQSRFTLGFSADTEPIWPIPIRIFWGTSVLENAVMQSRDMHVPYPSNTGVTVNGANTIKTQSPFYKLNHEGAGFYRVRYTEETFGRLMLAGLPAIEKLNLLADRFALAFACLCDFPINYLNFFYEESNYEVLLVLLDSIVRLMHIFYEDVDRREFLRKELLSLIDIRVKTIDLINSEYKRVNDISVAALLVNLAVVLGSVETLTRFSLLVTPDNLLDPNYVHKEYLRAYFVANADSHFKQLFEIAQKKSFISTNALFAIGLVTKLTHLHFIFDSFELLPRQDVIYFFSALSSNILLRHEAMNLFILNYDKIKKHICDYNLLRICIERVFSVVLEKPHVETAINFLNSLKIDTNLTSALENALDSITYKIRLRTYHLNKPFN